MDSDRKTGLAFLGCEVDRYDDGGGTLLVALPRPGLLVTKTFGKGTVKLARVIEQRVIDAVAENGRLICFHDFSEVTSHEPGTRKVLTDNGVRHRSTVPMSHILFASPLIAMGVTVAMLALPGRITSYADRLEYMLALRREMRDQSGS